MTLKSAHLGTYPMLVNILIQEFEKIENINHQEKGIKTFNSLMFIVL